MSENKRTKKNKKRLTDAGNINGKIDIADTRERSRRSRRELSKTGLKA